MWHMDDGMGWWMFFVALFWTLALAVFLYVITTLRGGQDASGSRRDHHDPGLSATEVLERRYAAGEIDREEFQRMREDLALNRPASKI